MARLLKIPTCTTEHDRAGLGETAHELRSFPPAPFQKKHFDVPLERVAKDAVGSRTTGDRDAGVHRIERRGAELVTSEMVVFEWLQTCNHAQSREVLKLIKNIGSETQKNEHDTRIL